MGLVLRRGVIPQCARGRIPTSGLPCKEESHFGQWQSCSVVASQHFFAAHLCLAIAEEWRRVLVSDTVPHLCLPEVAGIGDHRPTSQRSLLHPQSPRWLMLPRGTGRAIRGKQGLPTKDNGRHHQRRLCSSASRRDLIASALPHCQHVPTGPWCWHPTCLLQRVFPRRECSTAS